MGLVVLCLASPSRWIKWWPLKMLIPACILCKRVLDAPSRLPHGPLSMERTDEVAVEYWCCASNAHVDRMLDTNWHTPRSIGFSSFGACNFWSPQMSKHISPDGREWAGQVEPCSSSGSYSIDILKMDIEPTELALFSRNHNL